MFPLKNIDASHIINNGTHMMIYNRATEINACLMNYL
jgi:hypothetical protein